MVRNNSSNSWLIHFSADDWWTSNPHSRHHITNEFYRRGYNVLWVNPMGMRFPSVWQKGFKRKALNKIRSISKTLRKNMEGFYIFSFLYIPFFKRGLHERLNTILIRIQLTISIRLLGIERAICFASLPSFAPIIHSLKEAATIKPIIYYYSDQYDRYREITDRQPILEWDRMLRNDADAIYCASEKILNSIPEEYIKSKIVKVIEHQLDFDLFDYKKVKPKTINIKKPIIGYFGSLTDSNDWDMIRYAAARRPDWSFVFIGSKSIDLSQLEKMPNVHFLGYVPYTELPSVAVNFSVGIMFWKMTGWIKACSPLKLKEYLALGLPVISVPIDEVVNRYSRYVDFATDGPSFVAAIENALNKTCSEDRRIFASKFSWEKAVDTIFKDCNLDI